MIRTRVLVVESPKLYRWAIVLYIVHNINITMIKYSVGYELFKAC